MLVGSLLISAAGLSFARLPRTPVIGLTRGTAQDVIPRRIGGWTEVSSPEDIVLPPEDERKAAATYDEQVMRAYAGRRSEAVMLLVAYARSQSSMLMVHRPESCYPGAGFTILSNEAVKIRIGSSLSIDGRFLTTKRDSRVEQVLYWTRFGNEMPSDWDAQRWSIAVQALHGYVPDGVLVRLSTVSQDALQSLNLLRLFAAELVRTSGQQGRGLLLGPANLEI
ncbi:exosortase-associated protein EpsI, V-type [Novosphingobium chloroacetimidivorans]